MRDFYHQRFTVLRCGTIIETGIDVPNANTIVTNRADRLGLPPPQGRNLLESHRLRIPGKPLDVV